MIEVGDVASALCFTLLTASISVRQAAALDYKDAAGRNRRANTTATYIEINFRIRFARVTASSRRDVSRLIHLGSEQQTNFDHQK
jgi:hypothetical protein